MGMADVFGASVPAFTQVTTWFEAEQLQPTPVAELKLSPAGKVSITVMRSVVGLVAVAAFLTVMVYCPVVPMAKLPLCVLAMVRSGLHLPALPAMTRL